MSDGQHVGEIAVQPCDRSPKPASGHIAVTGSDGRVLIESEVSEFWSSGPLIFDDGIADYLVVEVEGFGGQESSHVVGLPHADSGGGIDPFVSGLLLGVLIPTALALVQSVFRWRRRYLVSLAEPLMELSRGLDGGSGLEVRRAYEALGHVSGLSGWGSRIRTEAGIFLSATDSAERRVMAARLAKRVRRHAWKTR